MIPPRSAPPAGPIHRCHLAAQWCERFGFAPGIAPRALVSRGVRDSLARLFRHFSRRGARVWLPVDNYPVFFELARDAGLQVSEFETLTEPVWPTTPPTGEPELLLVTNPLKPLGRWLDDADAATLQRWLAAHPERRVVLDTVYTFETKFDAPTRALIGTAQTILLHSLTKGWLEPRLFGVALVPERDATILAGEFRIDPPSQESLARARELLRSHATMPHRVADALAQARKRLRAAIPREIATRANLDLRAPGYFAALAMPWSTLLTHANVLGIPATVFGSRRDDITILSSLSFCT